MYIDLSHRLSSETPVFPSDTPVSVTQNKRTAEDGYNNHIISMSVHTGTHLDTPLHYFSRPLHVADFPVDQFCGPAKVFDCIGIDPIQLTPAMQQQIQTGDIVLFRTGFDLFWGTDKYYADYPVVDDTVADFLISKGIKIVGVDAAGPDKSPYPLHKKFFESDICLLENLCNLDKLLEKETIELFAFPLKLLADSSPVRAVARIS